MIRNKRPYDPNYRAVHTHSPITIDFSESIRYSISKEGKVTIQVLGDDNEYDEVVVSASLIFRIADALNLTRSTEMVKRDNVQEKSIE